MNAPICNNAKITGAMYRLKIRSASHTYPHSCCFIRSSFQMGTRGRFYCPPIHSQFQTLYISSQSSIICRPPLVYHKQTFCVNIFSYGKKNIIWGTWGIRERFSCCLVALAQKIAVIFVNIAQFTKYCTYHIDFYRILCYDACRCTKCRAEIGAGTIAVVGANCIRP